MQSIDGMIALLVAHPEVLGLMEYGGARHDDESIHGDYDLFVFLKHKDPQVESLHFLRRRSSGRSQSEVPR